MMMKKNILLLTGLFFGLTLSACSRVNYMLDSKVSVNYQNNQAIKALEVPPDLTAPEYDRSFDLPEGGTISAVAMQNGGMAPAGFAPSAPSATARTGKLASIRTQGGSQVVQIHDTYRRALILTDIILQRMNFNMIRRDEARGIYTVEYVGQDVASGKKKNFLTRMFKRSSNKLLVNGKTYQVHVNNVGGIPLLSFKDSGGQALSTENNTKIITMINDEFNR